MPTAPQPEDAETPVTIYVTPFCGFCRAALRLLEQKNVAFTAHDVSGDHEARRWMQTRSGQSTVPQIFVRGRSLGGYTELAELDRTGELAAQLAS